MKYYIGIDGGGTKTRFVCTDEKMIEVARVTLPSCHILQVQPEQAIQTLKTGIMTVKENLPVNSEIYICAGLAGYGKDVLLREKIEKCMQQACYQIPYMIESDARIALSGALDNQDGILAIAGTGSIALSKEDGLLKRCGGWGYLLGDEGSAYWIAKRLLQEYTMQIDGRREKSKIVSAVQSYCHLKDSYDLISYISSELKNERNQIAKLAEIVYQLASQNDSIALQIYEEAAAKIAELINTLALDTNKQYIASYAGGVFQAGEFIIKPLKKALKSNVSFIRPLHEPAYGAILLAKQKFK